MALEELSLYRTKVKDLGPLKGMPLRDLRLAESSVQDFGQLRGMPLTKLDVAQTGFDDADLEGLAGTPLVEFVASRTRLTRLTGLAGAPLTRLEITETAVSDLSPVASAPLKYVDLWRTRVRDLGPLKGKPLTWLSLAETPVEDVGAVSGTPLKTLLLHGSRPARPAPLAGCRELEELTIPARSADIQFLHDLPRLKRLGYRTIPGSTPATTAEEFWAEHDAVRQGDYKTTRPAPDTP